MIRLPHTSPWSPAVGFASVLASVATLVVAVVLPGVLCTSQCDQALIAFRDARATQVTVTLERVDVDAARPVASIDRPLATTGVLAPTRS